MRNVRIGVLAGGLLLGLGAEWASLRPHELELNAGDLAVGWAFIASGLIAWSQRPESRIGVLLGATGFAWLLGSFESSDVPALATLGGIALMFHRGPLVHAILSYPSGRLSRRLDRTVVCAAYLDGAIAPLGQSDPATIALAVAVLVAATHGYLTGTAPERRARAPAVAAAAAVALVLGIGSIYRLVGDGATSDRITLWAYQLVLVAIAVGFLADLLSRGGKRADVTNLVVELGESAKSATLRDRLADAVGDRSLVLAYWLPEEQRYVDDRGDPLSLPEPGSGREVTPVKRDGDRIAALVHDPAVLDDPRLVEAVASAASIAVSNVRLEAEVRTQIVELQTSRRRILEAADAQRRRLEQELHDGAQRRLGNVEEALKGAIGDGQDDCDGSVARSLAEVVEELRLAKAELREFASGIRPRALTEGGLAAGLAALAQSASVPVTVRAPAERLPAPIEAVAYFVCSEALANTGKYARASHAAIAASADDRELEVVITDDGVGGADPDSGSGLRGLADRVEAVGGRLHVDSPPGRGTRVIARLPRALS